MALSLYDNNTAYRPNKYFVIISVGVDCSFNAPMNTVQFLEYDEVAKADKIPFCLSVDLKHHTFRKSK